MRCGWSDVLTMNNPRRGSAFDVYMQAIADLRFDPDEFSFHISRFDGDKMSLTLSRDEVGLSGDVAISEGLMNAAFVLKIGTLLNRGIPPTFRKDSLHATPSASGTVSQALLGALNHPPQNGWTLIPLCGQGTWCLIVVKHGDANNDGCVFS